MSDITYSGQYINYQSIHDKSFILEFIKDKVYSNTSNLHKTVKLLCDYESKRVQHNKIYANNLRIMIPKYLSKQEKHEVIKKFLLKINPNFKVITYIYKFISIGNGTYIDVIIFERRIYQKPLVAFKKYKRDMRINRFTGKTTKSTDPDAILLCRKGEVMKDKKGNSIIEKIRISPKKCRYLNYRDSNVEKKKRMYFENFINKLKEIIMQTLSDITSNLTTFYKKLKNKKYSKNFSESKRIKVLNYNQRINEINYELLKIQRLFHLYGAIDDHQSSYKEFNKMFYSLTHIIENEKFYFNKSKKYELSISITKRMSFKNLNRNLDLFRDFALSKIQGWYAKEYYYRCLFFEGNLRLNNEWEKYIYSKKASKTSSKKKIIKVTTNTGGADIVTYFSDSIEVDGKITAQLSKQIKHAKQFLNNNREIQIILKVLLNEKHQTVEVIDISDL